MTAQPSLTFSNESGAIPALGFGTSPLTGGLSVMTALAALKAGYRHIDTARKYGTEPIVGEALRGRRRAAQRHLPHHQGQPRKFARR